LKVVVFSPLLSEPRPCFGPISPLLTRNSQNPLNLPQKRRQHHIPYSQHNRANLGLMRDTICTNGETSAHITNQGEFDRWLVFPLAVLAAASGIGH
jgi:hypothetical protein